LGGFLKENGELSILDTIKEKISNNSALSAKNVADALNFWGNRLSHFNSDLYDHPFNPQSEAVLMLARSIDNFTRCTNKITEKMQNFCDPALGALSLIHSAHSVESPRPPRDANISKETSHA